MTGDGVKHGQWSLTMGHLKHLDWWTYCHVTSNIYKYFPVATWVYYVVNGITFKKLAKKIQKIQSLAKMPRAHPYSNKQTKILRMTFLISSHP